MSVVDLTIDDSDASSTEPAPALDEVLAALEASPAVAAASYCHASPPQPLLINRGIPPNYARHILLQCGVHDELSAEVVFMRHHRWRYMGSSEVRALLHLAYLHALPASLVSRGLLFVSAGQSSIGAVNGEHPSDTRADAAMAVIMGRRLHLWNSNEINRLVFVCGDVNHWVTLCWVKGDGGCRLLLFDSLHGSTGHVTTVAYWQQHIAVVEQALDIVRIGEHVVQFPRSQRQTVSRTSGDYSCGARAVFCACLVLIASRQDLLDCDSVGVIPTARGLSSETAANLHAFISKNRRELLRLWPLVALPYCKEYLPAAHPFRALVLRLAACLPAPQEPSSSRFWSSHFIVGGTWKLQLYPTRYKTGRNGRHPPVYTSKVELEAPCGRRTLLKLSRGKNRKVARINVYCKLLQTAPWAAWLMRGSDMAEEEQQAVYKQAVLEACKLPESLSRVSDQQWDVEIQQFIQNDDA